MDVLEVAIKRLQEEGIQPNISTQLVVASNLSTASLPTFSWRQELIYHLDTAPYCLDDAPRSLLRHLKLAYHKLTARSVMEKIFHECLIAEDMIQDIFESCECYNRDEDKYQDDYEYDEFLIVAECYDNTRLSLNMCKKRIETANRIHYKPNANFIECISKLKGLIRSYAQCLYLEI